MSYASLYSYNECVGKAAYRKAFVIYLFIVLIGITTQGWLFEIAKVFAAGPTASASISAQSQQGDNSWYIDAVTVTISATPQGTPVKSITYWLNADAPATVPTTTSTTQTFSQNGTHTLYFYATDENNVKGTQGSITFKIDTISPKNWTNIVQTRNGNDHTFTFSANVTDVTAGLDPARTYMQYNIDDTGSSWGYYSNPKQCSSTWMADQWMLLPTQSFAAGATSGTISTPPVDYCNSSGGGCDFMKVRVYDMSGNFADKKICLGGPWLQTQYGGVHSVASIAMVNEGPQPNATGMITSQNTITNFSSLANQYITNYTSNTNLSGINYATLNAKVGATAASLPLGRLPTTNGFYKVNGSLSVTSSLFPAGYATTQNFANVILVDGNLTISSNIITHASSVVIFVVNGTIDIAQSVSTVSGIYVAGGMLDTSYNGNSNTQLIVNGSLFSAGGFDFARTLGTTTNKTTPAERINYQPQYLLNSALKNLFAGTARYDWREVDP